MASCLKLVVMGATSENVLEATKFANHLAGIDNRSCNIKNFSPLRILEFVSKEGYNIEVWNLQKPLIPVPEICLYEAHGLVLISSELPKVLIDQKRQNLLKTNFPILWLVTGERFTKHNHSSNFNVHQVQFTKSEGDSMQNEFDNWIENYVLLFSRT